MTDAVAAWTSHPAFAPWRRRLEGCGREVPSVETLRAWAEAEGLALPDGRALRLVHADGRMSALEHEASIACDATLPVRPGSWHDALNVLAWLSLPRTKAALNAIHVGRGRAPTQNARDRVRDAATLLDESGLLLGCDDASLPPLLAGHAWRELFVARAGDVRRQLRPVAIGHGLLDKLRAPFRAITAKALVVPFARGTLPRGDDLAALDLAAADAVAAPAFVPEGLHALPVAALPGRDAEGAGERLFDDAAVFRPPRTRARAAEREG
jgi:hypothetical protein